MTLRPREPWHDAVLGLGGLALRAWGVRVRVTDAEHLPHTGPVILACNHVSFPDFVTLQKAVLPSGRRVRFLCRANIFAVPVVGGLMQRMRHVPVDRAAPAAAYLAARRLLVDGRTVGIFPEAGVSQALTVRPLMRGAAALALATGAPLVPVATWGGQRLWPVGPGLDGRRRRPDRTRGRVVDVRIDAPLRPLPGEDATTLTVRLGERLAGLLDDLQALPDQRPAPGETASWYPAHLGGAAPSAEVAAARESVPRSAVAVRWGPAPRTRPDLGGTA